MRFSEGKEGLSQGKQVDAEGILFFYRGKDMFSRGMVFSLREKT
jgi:hypothetical protein